MLVLMIVGIVFSATGLLIIIGCIAANQTEALVFGVLFGGIFFVVGLGLIYSWIAAERKKNNILKNGERVWGTIVDYADDCSLYVNGVPALDIIVRCNYRGESKLCRLKTQQTKEKKFPVGANILLAVYQEQVEFFKKSVGGNAGL